MDATSKVKVGGWLGDLLSVEHLRKRTTREGVLVVTAARPAGDHPCCTTGVQRPQCLCRAFPCSCRRSLVQTLQIYLFSKGLELRAVCQFLLCQKATLVQEWYDVNNFKGRVRRWVNEMFSVALKKTLKKLSFLSVFLLFLWWSKFFPSIFFQQISTTFILGKAGETKDYTPLSAKLNLTNGLTLFLCLFLYNDCCLFAIYVKWLLTLVYGRWIDSYIAGW